MNDLYNKVLSDIFSRRHQQEVARMRDVSERRKWEEDPARPATLLAHLQRENVPDKKREKLGAGATLEKVESSIPSGDPRKGIGMEALALTRKILPETPAGVHPQDVLSGIFKKLSADRSEETNRYVQKQESGIFGDKGVAKPEGYQEWKAQFLAENAPSLADSMTNPLASMVMGGGIAAAGEGVKRLLAGELGKAEGMVIDPMTKNAIPALSKILPTGERVAAEAFAIEGTGRGLTGLGRAVSHLPFGDKVASWAMRRGGQTIGTKLIGRALMAAPPAGPVGIGMKIAGAALMAIPEFAMFDLATFAVKKAAPEWSAQRETEAGLIGGALSVPGIIGLHKTLGKLLTKTETAKAVERTMIAKPTGDNLLLGYKAQETAAKAEDQHLIGYRRLLEHKPMPPSGVAAEDFWPGGPPSDAPIQPMTSGVTTAEAGFSMKGLPLPESLKGKMLGEGFVSQDIVNTHIYDYKSMLKGFATELSTAGRSPGEALASARETIKRGIGLELINSAQGGLVSGMPMKMRLLGPHGVEQVFHEVAVRGTDLGLALDNALITRQQFGKDVFKNQVYGISPTGEVLDTVAKERLIQDSANSFSTMAEESAPMRIAQTNGLRYDGMVDYSAIGQGKIFSFTDPTTNSSISGKSLEDIEKNLMASRAGYDAAKKSTVQRESFSKELEVSIAKTASKEVPVVPETSKIELSGMDRVKAARGETYHDFKDNSKAPLALMENEFRTTYPDADVILAPHIGQNQLNIDRLYVPEKLRGGVGKEIIGKIQDFADKHEVVLSVQPSSEVPGLIKWYKERGFVKNPNKGGELLYTPEKAQDLETMFSKQPQEAILKGETTAEMHATLDKKMDLYRTNPSSLSDEDFAILHNAESSSWHKPEAVKRYKEIINARRAAIPESLKPVADQLVSELDSLGSKITADVGEAKAGKIFDKAGKAIKGLKPEEVKFLKGEGLSDEDIHTKILHEVTKGKYLSLLLGGLVAGGTMVSLPEDVYAGAPDLAGRTVLKAVMDGAKGFKGGIMSFANELKANGLLSPKLSADGMKVESYQKPFVVVPDFDAITRKKRLPFGLDRILSPYTLGQVYYSGAKEGMESMSNPAVGIASAQTAADNNTADSLKAFYTIMKNFGIKPAYKEVRTAMAETSKKYQPIISETAAHYEQAKILSDVLKKAEKSLKKASTEEVGEINASIADLKSKLKLEGEAISASKDKIAQFHGDYNTKITELGKKNSSVRVSLLMEEQEGKESLYPWLREYAQPNEYNAAARMKVMMKDYAGRMAEVGQDPITYKGYVHYAAHPDVNWSAIEKSLEGIQSGFLQGPSLIKFYERSIGGRNFMPDIFYSMEKYIPDANKRIAFGDFWGKGRENSWYSHANSAMVQSNDGLRIFWDTIRHGFVPFEQSKLNTISDRIQAFEVGRLLSFSPSVSFKHAIKLEATWSNMGWIESMKAIPETFTMWARKMTPERFKGNPTMEDQVFRTFINQGSMARTIADMEVAGVPHNLWDKATTWMNHHGAIMVNSVENFDRAHSMVAAGMMAAKKGMTASQAAYGVMDSVLKNNFLTGALNPSWLRDPKVRLLFLFQGTPFKIAEQRAINLWRSGKAVGRAAGESLELMKSLKGDVKEGEFILKAHAIKDALLSEKDIWGTPLVQQTMRKILVLGSMIATGSYVFGSNLWNHVIHAPFFEFEKEGVSLRLNPLTSAAYKTWQERGDEGKSDWMVDDFMKNWIKDPFVQNNIIKAMRLSKNDIPEIYKDSRVRYMLSVPGQVDEK